MARTKALLFFAGVAAFFPLLTYAESSGLVPCGVSTFTSYFDPNYYLSATGCNFCYLAQLIQKIVNFLIMVAIPISVAMFAWAGILFFTNAGNPKRIAQAKKIFSSVFIGFIIAVSGWLVVQVVLQAITNNDFYRGNIWTSCNSYNTGLNSQGQPLRPRDYKVNQFLGVISVQPGVPTPPTIPTLGDNTNPGNDAQMKINIDTYNTNNPNNQITTKPGVSYDGVNVMLMQSVMKDVSESGSAGGITITSANDSDGTHVSGSQHTSGNALDIVPADNQQFLNYMQTSSNFTRVTNQIVPGNPNVPAFQDKNGVIWSFEPTGTANSTGNHWHVSTNGH